MDLKELKKLLIRWTIMVSENLSTFCSPEPREWHFQFEQLMKFKSRSIKMDLFARIAKTILLFDLESRL